MESNAHVFIKKNVRWRPELTKFPLRRNHRRLHFCFFGFSFDDWLRLSDAFLAFRGRLEGFATSWSESTVPLSFLPLQFSSAVKLLSSNIQRCFICGLSFSYLYYLQGYVEFIQQAIICCRKISIVAKDCECTSIVRSGIETQS